MKINHNHFLDLAFNQAEINLGKSYLNNSVGSILVDNDSVILSGVSFKNILPRIAEIMGAIAIITSVFATFVFWIETTKVIFVTVKVPI